MAHKKGVGSTDNGRDSNSKRLGVKLFGGQAAKAGNIIIRQRGTKYHPGENVYMGRDFTIHAKVDGKVTFKKSYRNRMYVSILPDEAVVAAPRKPKPAKAAKAAPAPKAAPAKKAAPAPKPEPAPKPVEAKKPEPAPKPVEAKKPEPAPKPVEAKKPEPAPEVQKAAAIPPEAPAKKAPAKKKSSKIVLPSGKKISQDDLKVVEGIGPKISGLLNDIGIMTWRQLAEAPLEKVQAMLDEAGPRYRIHNPATWSQQALLAADEKWEELEKLQDELDGGKPKK